MKIKLPSLLVVLSEVPSIWRALLADLRAATAANSEGGAKVTRDELEAIAADIGLRFGSAVGRLLFAANGIGD